MRLCTGAGFQLVLEPRVVTSDPNEMLEVMLGIPGVCVLAVAEHATGLLVEVETREPGWVVQLLRRGGGAGRSSCRGVRQPTAVLRAAASPQLEDTWLEVRESGLFGLDVLRAGGLAVQRGVTLLSNDQSGRPA